MYVYASTRSCWLFRLIILAAVVKAGKIIKATDSSWVKSTRFAERIHIRKTVEQAKTISFTYIAAPTSS